MSVLDDFKSDLEQVSAVKNVWIEEEENQAHVKVDGREYPHFAEVVDEYRSKGVTMIKTDKGAVREYIFSAE